MGRGSLPNFGSLTHRSAFLLQTLRQALIWIEGFPTVTLVDDATPLLDLLGVSKHILQIGQNIGELELCKPEPRGASFLLNKALNLVWFKPFDPRLSRHKVLNQRLPRLHYMRCFFMHTQFI